MFGLRRLQYSQCGAFKYLGGSGSRVSYHIRGMREFEFWGKGLICGIVPLARRHVA